MLKALRFLVVLALAALPAAAQTPADILARYTRTIDPEGKYASIEGMKTTISVEIASVGMRLNVVAHQSKPSMMVTNIEIPGMGMMRTGYDGTTAWASDAMQGPRILTGLEASTLIDGADWRASVRSPELFSAMTMAGEADVNGDRAQCVALTWKSGRETTECFSVATGLLTESRSRQTTQMGEMEVIAHSSDYRMVNGVMIAHRMTQNAMGMMQVMTITGIEFGKQDAALFELPPEVKALKP